MKPYHLSAVAFLLAILPASSCWADSIVLKNFASNDNEGLDQHKHTLGYIKSLETKPAIANIGVHGGYWWFDELDSEKRFSILGLSGDFTLGDAGMLLSEVMHYSNGAWSTETFNLTYRQPNLKPVYLEANIERSIVDSFIAISNQITVDTYSASLDYPVGKNYTFVGAGIYQDFSDNNSKRGGLLKFIYNVQRIENLTTALVFKQLNSETRGTGYFSPEKQQRLYLDTSYATGIINDKFLLKTSLGIGAEAIDSDTRNTLLKIEFSMRGWFNDHNGLEARLGCSNTGDALSNRDNSNYRYCYANLNYTHALD